MTSFVDQTRDALERVKALKKHPAVVLSGHTASVDALVKYIEGTFHSMLVLEHRQAQLAAAALHRHFSPGEPLPPQLFDDLFKWGAAPYYEACSTPFHKLVGDMKP